MPSQKLTVGNVEITSLSDGEMEFDLCNFFPTIPGDEWVAHEEHLTDEHRVRFNLACYLIRSEGHTILVDTGLGPKPSDMPNAGWGRLADDLNANGIAPGDIDMVVMTHLHRDHVGWNLSLKEGRYEPTFPSARYFMSRLDWEACHRPELKERFSNAPDCVWPLEELGLAELMDGEKMLTNELMTLPTPGHTPGHMSIMITSGGERAIILGDVLHNTVQIEQTDWVSRADMDAEQTRVTRRGMMEKLEQEGILVAAVHLPAPGFGKVVRLEGRRYWQKI